MDARQRLQALYEQATPGQRADFWQALMDKYPQHRESICAVLIQSAIARQKAATAARRNATIAAKKAAA